MSPMTCPICETGTLKPTTYSNRINYRGHALLVDGLVGLLCSNCDEITIGRAHSRANQEKYAAAKRAAADTARADKGLLDGVRIRAMREAFGLTQSQASFVFGGGFNAFSKYERGEIYQSEPMDLLLRVAEAVPDAARWLLHFANISAVETEKRAWVVQGRYSPHDMLLDIESIPVANDDCGESNSWRVCGYNAR